MAAGYQDPAISRRRLRVELRRLRRDLDLTQADVADEMDWSPSKLIRMEHGDVRIATTDLRALLAHYGVSDRERVQELVELSRAAKEDPWSEYQDVHSKDFLTYLGYEASALTIRSYESALVPGLLQTEEYARAVLVEAYQNSPEAVERRWSARQRRQEIHEHERSPRMTFILDEAAIRREVGGPRVMRRQMERLIAWSNTPHIDIRVIPFEAGAHPGMRGPFVLLEFPDPMDDDFLYLEAASGESTTTDDDEEITRYNDRYTLLERQALSAEASRERLEGVKEVLESTVVAEPAS